MFLVLVLISSVGSYSFPGSCDPGYFYEPTSMDCMACHVNASLVTSEDGFGCSCDVHSIQIGVLRCKPCNITEMVTTDRTACVPRRCQSSVGRIICRKCPLGYISVTQNFDGSPMKEVQCIKCARGYKAVKNRCAKCEACSCGKSEISIRGKCLPKKYLSDRPKYSQRHLHPDELLEMVKLEFLCTQRDVRACRDLASICVRNFYTSEPAGPCRLWIQPNLVNFTGLPFLTIDNSRYRPEFTFERNINTLNVIMAIHKYGGGFQMLTDQNQVFETCLPPFKIIFGENTLRNCAVNISKFTSSDYMDIFELYLKSDNDLNPLPILIRKPNGYYIKKDVWSTDKFRKFFFLNKYRSTTNTTDTMYLAALLLRVTVYRDTSKKDSLQLRLSVEAQYATKSPSSEMVTVLLRVEHDIPKVGILRALEVCAGTFGIAMVLYALIQWRGAVKRGAAYIVIIPILTGCISDVLYFAIFLSTFFALATESGTLGLTLPLSRMEEKVIEILIYVAISLKSVKVIWMNWNQCCCDIFFVDWSKYNSDEVMSNQDGSNIWKIEMLAREWTSVQTKRRVSPGYTVTITLLVLYLLSIWKSNIKYGQDYKWVVTTAAWWCSYIALLCLRFVIDKFVDTHSTVLVKLCEDLELSFLIFQEEYYSHYINGRSHESMHFRSMIHSLSSCRIICAPQMRAVYKKLTTADDITDIHSRRDLLTKFLAAFFERALDGLHWVASERTIVERLFDVEFVSRESGSTSVLLYDSGVIASCFAMTWWGEEWTLATFDAMLFGFVLITSDQTLLAALVTLIIWKVMKHMRMWLGNWNLRRKINLIS